MFIPRNKPLKRSSKPIRPRAKARPGRLKGDDLQCLRLDCFARDKGICDECGCQTFIELPHEAPNSFHMAHIRGKRMHGDNLANVRILCGDDHRREHQWGKSMEKPCKPKHSA